MQRCGYGVEAGGDEVMKNSAYGGTGQRDSWLVLIRVPQHGPTVR